MYRYSLGHVFSTILVCSCRAESIGIPCVSSLKFPTTFLFGVFREVWSIQRSGPTNVERLPCLHSLSSVFTTEHSDSVSLNKSFARDHALFWSGCSGNQRSVGRSIQIQNCFHVWSIRLDSYVAFVRSFQTLNIHLSHHFEKITLRRWSKYFNHESSK